ncbi:NERD domain-containing protein [Paraglaciecola sp.]|uniref:nuclease-related domain-containing DEAD/DEAH box helicase n=1 Tax=Paraglaciecola sp. TaxID=1920173 RepID=UPI003EF450E4
MSFVPTAPYNTDSKAEKNLFYRLLEKLYDLQDCHVFHSYNVHNHPYKVTGEADFLILSKYGLFALEVKGGGISVEEGTWFSTNNSGKHIIQDPFKQAHSSIFTVREDILKQAGLNVLQGKLGIGYGVVFPDTFWNTVYGEYDRRIICDKSNFKTPEKWLLKLFRYWFERPNQGHALTPETIRKIKHYLRPNIEYVESLGIKLEESADKQVKLTESQFNYIDVFESFPRLLCKGGAGTGKTFLAAEMARRLSASGKSVLLVCKSKWLAVYLKEIISVKNLIICSVDNLNLTIRRSDYDEFDSLIVDEGQDMFNFDDIDGLSNAVSGGIEDGNWYIFHDFENQTGLVGESSLEAYQYLQSNSIGEHALKSNCRNTANILDIIKSYLRVDMGITGTGFGPDVRELETSKTDAAKQLLNVIDELRKDGVSPESITVLSPFSYSESSVSQLPGSMLKKIIQLDEYSIKNPKQNGIGFSEIKNFKGLENDVVVLIDLPSPDEVGEDYDYSNHYVGMSRAKGLLVTVWCNL